MANPLDFGVQSFCFRNVKDNAQVASMVRELGLNKIEVCAVHADFNDLAAWKQIVATYRNEGVSIVSIGVQTLDGADNEEDWFACAAEAGANHMSVHFRPDSFQKALARGRKWSRQYGVKLGIHNHGGYMFGGSPDVIRHLIDLGGPEVGLCLDTAWCMQIGPRQGIPEKWVGELFKECVFGLHYKDFLFEKNGKWTDTVVGEGNLNLPALIKALRDINFDGFSVIEYEGNPDNPVPALRRCIERMRELAQ